MLVCDGSTTLANDPTVSARPCYVCMAETLTVFYTQMSSQSGLERHPDLYFADGDVVLAAKLKQTPESKDVEERPRYQLFRVHKFLLKHRSPTFTNFFGDASAAPTEVYDGVPLAEMHGDKAEDFALLLGYLYNAS